MDDVLQADKNTQSTAKNSDCCGVTPGIQILETAPILESSSTPCCGADPGETMASGGVIGTDRSSGVLKSTSFWGWGFAGLIGIAIMAGGTGLIPGLKPETFRQQIMSNAVFVGKAIWSILPFFLLSVGISAWVTVSGFAERIKAVFNQRQKIAIAGAAIVGATIPLCSCGVIPLIAALLSSGVPLGPVMALWISSPLMNRYFNGSRIRLPDICLVVFRFSEQSTSRSEFVSAIMLRFG